MSYLLTILYFMPLFATFALIIQYSHLLMALLSLEGIMLSLVLLTPMILMEASVNAGIMCILLLTMGVCEASLGLALLVLLSRSCGTDMLNNLTVNKC